MGKKGNMKFYTFEETKDKIFGKIGTPERDEYERTVLESVRAYQMGEAIKQARLSKNLTQEQLGELIGVKRSQVSRIEKGKNLTLSTISRVFGAMKVPISFNVAGVGNFAL